MHVLLTILLAHPTITDTEAPDPVAAVQEGETFLFFSSFGSHLLRVRLLRLPCYNEQNMFSEKNVFDRYQCQDSSAKSSA